MHIKKVDSAAPTFTTVEVREPLVDDLIQAERMTGKEQGIEFAVALVSRIATFDGKRLPPEDLRQLAVRDFLLLGSALDVAGLEALGKELVSSRGKAAGPTENSAS